MNNIPLMQIPNRIQDLLDSLRSILFRKLSILANAIKQFSSGREFGHNVIFILSNHQPPLYKPDLRDVGIPSTQTNRESARYEDDSIAAEAPSHRRPSAHCRGRFSSE